jgi:orotate phosphoribosyltransferase
MQSYQQDFLQLALDREVLKFGEFQLKSGRISPYFFNLGLISDGAGMTTTANCYADALLTENITFDMLFGPAYKGIPLVTAVAMALAAKGRNIPYAYNRKEAKDHGEGGRLVGAALSGKVVIVDDVMTAGTAVREAISMVQAAGAEVAGVLIALDRQERANDQTTQSAVQLLSNEGIPVYSIVGLDQVIEHLNNQDTAATALTAIQQYRQQYGV